MTKEKKVQFYPSMHPLHTLYNTLLTNPPEGYEFIKLNEGKSFVKKVKSSKILKGSYKLFTKLFKINLFQNMVSKENVSEEIDIIYSTGVLYLGNKPWILDICDNPYSLSGYKYNLFMKNKKKIEDTLLKDNCKAITYSYETAYKVLKKHFCDEVLRKTKLVRFSVRDVVMQEKKDNKDFFQILFMGSINNPDDFFLKGGLETLEVFKKLSKEYPNIKLIVRSKIPEGVKEKYSMKNVIFIEERISYNEVDDLYKNSDVLLLPGHITGTSLLEAMSFALPIIALDSYQANEYVTDNRNGFLIKPSNKIDYNYLEYPLDVRSKHFMNLIKEVDERVIKELSEKIEFFIRNPLSIKRFGEEGKKIAENKFSIKQRNEKLKKILDKID